MEELFGESGEPNFRQLEPYSRLGQTGRCASACGLSATLQHFHIEQRRPVDADRRVVSSTCDWSHARFSRGRQFPGRSAAAARPDRGLLCSAQ
jgi:hypothetical protein